MKNNDKADNKSTQKPSPLTYQPNTPITTNFNTNLPPLTINTQQQFLQLQFCNHNIQLLLLLTT